MKTLGMFHCSSQHLGLGEYMKNILLLVTATLATFSFSNGTAFAACADDIRLQEARMTAQNAQEAESLEAAFKYMKEAKLLCARGDESKAANVLNQLKTLLTNMGR